MPERPASTPPRPLAQQIDLDGQLHDLAPQSEAMRLFTPAPAPIAGQTRISEETNQ